jgi:hypothetical protein
MHVVLFKFQVGRPAKLEKADILEMTVEFVRKTKTNLQGMLYHIVIRTIVDSLFRRCCVGNPRLKTRHQWWVSADAFPSSIYNRFGVVFCNFFTFD